MSDAKPFATLTPTLLARKGGAKPAMRPQLQPLQEFHQNVARDLEVDLGWNDMGSDGQPEDPGAEIVPISAKASQPRKGRSVVALVNKQQARLSVGCAQDRRSPAASQGHRAAFTLRLDTDRHLKLRLASTVLGRSAQDIVSEALDSHIAGLAGIEALAASIRENR